MKKFLTLALIAIVFSSCQDEVKFNSPGLQGRKDDVFWRANDIRAYIATNGKLTVEGLTQFEQLTLNTSSANVGTYVLGSTTTSNSATYTSLVGDIEFLYATIAVPGPVSTVGLVSGGTGYSSMTNVATTGGTGSGLTVSIVTNSSGVVTSTTLSSRGNGYMPGDIITVVGGNLNCRLRILNTQNSNGEIKITQYDNVNMTISGKFKFNAVNVNDNPFGAPFLNFQYREFYKIPIYPSM